jgi:hypothetical protein
MTTHRCSGGWPGQRQNHDDDCSFEGAIGTIQGPSWVRRLVAFLGKVERQNRAKHLVVFFLSKYRFQTEQRRLCSQRPCLSTCDPKKDPIRHVRKRYDDAGGSICEGSNGEAGYVEEVRQFALLVKDDVCRVGRICKEVRIRRAQDL